MNDKNPEAAAPSMEGRHRAPARRRLEEPQRKQTARVTGWRVEDELARRVAVVAAAAEQPQVEAVNRLLRTWSKGVGMLLGSRRAS
jgi:hypothetical protein